MAWVDNSLKLPEILSLVIFSTASLNSMAFKVFLSNRWYLDSEHTSTGNIGAYMVQVKVIEGDRGGGEHRGGGDWLEVVDVGEEVLEESEAVRAARVRSQLVVTETVLLLLFLLLLLLLLCPTGRNWDTNWSEQFFFMHTMNATLSISCDWPFEEPKEEAAHHEEDARADEEEGIGVLLQLHVFLIFFLYFYCYCYCYL